MLVDEFGSQAALAKAIEKSPAQISQWINASKDSKTGKPRSMDRETARRIERALGKPDGWMDQPITDGLTTWPFPGIDPARFENLTPEQKIEIRGVVRNMINGFETERGNVPRNGTDP